MRLKKTLAIGMLSLGLVGGLAGAAAAGCFTDPVSAVLSGSAETPTGDPDGSGKIKITFDTQEGLVCWSMTFKGIAKPTGAHIHKGAAGAAGPVVVPIPTPSDKGATKGCTAVGRALIKDIIASPGDYYFNVHTAEFPGGAVRGQLTKG